MTVPIAEFDQLMSEAMAGSEEAVWQLAQTYTPYIIRAVRASLSPQLQPKFDPQDLAQSLWASILLSGSDLTRLKTPNELIAFLARATRNKVIDKARYFKSKGRDIDREEPLPIDCATSNRAKLGQQARPLYARDDTPSALASARERWNAILSNISERDRRIVQLRLDGLSYDVIGAQLQIDEKTARRAMQKVVEQLRNVS